MRLRTTAVEVEHLEDIRGIVGIKTEKAERAADGRHGHRLRELALGELPVPICEQEE